MFGLAVLGAFVLYLLVSLIVVVSVAAWAGRHKRNRIGWGFGAALVMYNLVFWDWIPTVYVHKYYCEKEAGFWIYKTLDQWKAENPGAMVTLVEDKNARGKFVGDSKSYTLVEVLNQRFNRLTIRSRDVIPALQIGREEQQLVDTTNNFVIARQIGFGSHDEKWGGLKFWLNIGGCSNRNESMANFGNVADQFKGETK